MSKVSNKKSTKKLTKELIKESDNESIEKINKGSKGEFIEDLKQPFSLNNKSTTNWYDKNKFNKILTTIDNNIFNYKNKIDKLKFNDINNLISNIKSNAINKTDTKKKINELNKIKKGETKGQRLFKSQKKLRRLFDDLKTIFNNSNNNNNNSNNNNESNNKNENVNKNENENVNENENENENENDDEQCYEIKEINDNLKNIDKTKSFKDQIDILKEILYLSDYWYIEYYEDNKETNLIFLN